MISKALKIRMGLVVAVVFAVSAVAASSAQAAPTFAAGGYVATLSGSQVESLIYDFGEEVTCTSAEFSGTMSEAETMLVLAPSYGVCHAGMFGVYEVTFALNKCFYTVEVTKKSAKGEYSHIGVANLECPGGGQIEVKFRTPDKTIVCEYTIATATGLSMMRYGTLTPEGAPKDLLMGWEIAKLPYKRRVGTNLNCGAASGDATYVGSAKFTAKNEAGTPVNLEVTGM